LQAAELKVFKEANNTYNRSGNEKRRRFEKAQAHGHQLSRKPGATQAAPGLKM
jgi:hypothetical protein